MPTCQKSKGGIRSWVALSAGRQILRARGEALALEGHLAELGAEQVDEVLLADSLLVLLAQGSERLRVDRAVPRFQAAHDLRRQRLDQSREVGVLRGGD